MHSFTFNGHSSDEFGIRIERFPDLNRSERKYRSASVSGRNGNIYQMQNAWEEVTVSYQIFAGERQAGAAVADFTEIVEWLNSADDYAVLTDTYDPAHYRLAVFVDEMEIESEWHTFGKATIRFRCRPQRYLAQGTNLLPKMAAGTYSNNGATVVVDAKGKATMSGRTTAGGNVAIIPLENSITITQDMVDNDTYLYLNNYNLNVNTIIYFENNSSVEAFRAYAFDSEYSVRIPQSAVGKTVTRVRVYLATNLTASGTFMPKLQAESSVISVSDGDTVINPTNHTALPVITLTGSEIVTSMLDLEKPYNYSSDIAGISRWQNDYLNNIGFQYATYSGNKWVVDTYRQAGTPASEGASITAHVNSTGTLTFKPFRWVSNDVGVGRGITLTPDTDYTISCTTTAGNSKVWVGFFESGGNKYCISSAEATRSGAGELSLTFHVPATCMNALFIFYRTDNTTGTFSNIMLASGTEVLPFLPYASLATETLTINDTTLSFQTAGFNTAVIDCEKENFTIDGVNANMTATVYDQYGNLSTNYLRLVEGTNTVTYSSDITAVSIVPHFWDL